MTSPKLTPAVAASAAAGVSSATAKVLAAGAGLRAQGVPSGTPATSRVLGLSLSVAVAGAIFTSMGAAAAGVVLAAHRGALSPGRLAARRSSRPTGLALIRLDGLGAR